MYCMELFCLVLNCIVLRCVIFYCVAFYCIVSREYEVILPPEKEKRTTTKHPTKKPTERLRETGEYRETARGQDKGRGTMVFRRC